MSQEKENEEVLFDVQEQYSRTEKFIEDNKMMLIGGLAIIIIPIILFFAYTSLYLPPIQKEAAVAMFPAENAFKADNFEVALNGDGNNVGFLSIIEDYSQTAAGELAKYYAGVSYLNQGKYQEAINMLEDYSGDDKLVNSIATGALGDAYSETGSMEKAISSYESAASQSPNRFSSPYYLKKAGLLAEKQGDAPKAKSLYEKIQKDFPESDEARTIEKYIARVS